MNETLAEGAHSLGILEERGRIINLVSEIEAKGCCQDAAEAFDHILGLLHFGLVHITNRVEANE